jgi:peptide-methionine (S)-S-oxide reductase
VNRQGPDVGTQYRSAIFYFDDAQKEAAEAMKDQTGETARRPIATEITAAGPFWPAEDYHQQYEEKRMGATARLFGGWKR